MEQHVQLRGRKHASVAEYVDERSVFLSHRWEARSLKAHLRDVRTQAMYAVIHGGVDEDCGA